jgi:hypothetical protein
MTIGRRAQSGKCKCMRVYVWSTAELVVVDFRDLNPEDAEVSRAQDAVVRQNAQGCVRFKHATLEIGHARSDLPASRAQGD